MTRVRIAGVDEIGPGEMTSVQVEDKDVLLARIGDDFYAVDNLCSHAEGWLDMGYLYAETCEVRCPLHEGRFDLRTGKATHEPAYEPVASYRVSRTGDDVYVDLDD